MPRVAIADPSRLLTAEQIVDSGIAVYWLTPADTNCYTVEGPFTAPLNLCSGFTTAPPVLILWGGANNAHSIATSDLPPGTRFLRVEDAVLMAEVA